MQYNWGWCSHVNYGGFLCKYWHTHSKDCSPVIQRRISEKHGKDLKYKEKKKKTKQKKNPGYKTAWRAEFQLPKMTEKSNLTFNCNKLGISIKLKIQLFSDISDKLSRTRIYEKRGEKKQWVLWSSPAFCLKAVYRHATETWVSSRAQWSYWVEERETEEAGIRKLE